MYRYSTPTYLIVASLLILSGDIQVNKVALAAGLMTFAIVQIANLWHIQAEVKQYNKRTQKTEVFDVEKEW